MTPRILGEPVSGAEEPIAGYVYDDRVASPKGLNVRGCTVELVPGIECDLKAGPRLQHLQGVSKRLPEPRQAPPVTASKSIVVSSIDPPNVVQQSPR